MIGRPSWDQTFMDILPIIEGRVTCIYYKVATILALKGRIISFGYNGPGKGDDHCTEVGCAKLDKDGNKLPSGSGKCRGCHGEINVFLNMVFLGISFREDEAKKATLYVSISPCLDCAKHIANTGIKRIVYREKYDNMEGTSSYLEKQGVELIQFQGNKTL